MSNKDKHTTLTVNNEWFDYFKMTNSITLCNPNNPDDKLEFSSVEELLDFNRKIWELNKQFIWQPIETLPQNGKYYLFYDIKLDIITIGCLDKYAHGFENYRCQTDEPLFNPTHWMPLPKPPTN